jgi:ABC-type uncharacterized transport system permease subunit
MPTISRSRWRSRNPTAIIIAGEDLEAADMRIFSVLVVLHHAHLNHHGFEDVARIWFFRVLGQVAVLALEVVFVVRFAFAASVFATTPCLSAGSF